MKETQIDGIYSCSLTGRLNTIKMSVFPKTIYLLNTITTKNSRKFFFFKEINELIPKGSRIPKMTLNKKYKLAGLILCDFKMHNTATVVKAVSRILA